MFDLGNDIRGFVSGRFLWQLWNRGLQQRRQVGHPQEDQQRGGWWRKQPLAALRSLRKESGGLSSSLWDPQLKHIIQMQIPEVNIS